MGRNFCPETCRSVETPCCAEFWYLRKDNYYWLRNIADERLFCPKYGRVISYQVVSVFWMRNSYFENVFAEVTQYFKRLYVPRGCIAERPMIFSYKMEDKNDLE